MVAHSYTLRHKYVEPEGKSNFKDDLNLLLVVSIGKSLQASNTSASIHKVLKLGDDIRSSRSSKVTKFEAYKDRIKELKLFNSVKLHHPSGAKTAVNKTAREHVSGTIPYFHKKDMSILKGITIDLSSTSSKCYASSNASQMT